MKLDERPRDPARRYRLSPQRTAERLLLANREERWGFAEKEIVRFCADAPGWPEGLWCLRVPRVRLGRGSRGVARTFETHAARALRAFGDEGGGEAWRRLLKLPPDVGGRQELHLFAGDETHERGLSWCMMDCRPYGRTLVARDKGFVADELLVLAWLFPHFLREAFASRFILEYVALGYAVLDGTGRARGTRPRVGAVCLTLADRPGGNPTLELGVAWDADGFDDDRVSIPRIIPKLPTR
jgi:hypothetical protein